MNSRLRPPFRPFNEMLWVARFKALRGQETGTLVLRNVRAVIPCAARMIYRNGYQERQREQVFRVLGRLRARRRKDRAAIVKPEDRTP